MLKTMYPPQANSPLTTLAGALTQSATEIMVLAGVVLPDAPNLLVIGGETEQAETVLMTAKDGNTLTLVRAVQGVAREWPAGSTIARFFTAKDLEDIQDNIKTIAENYIPATEKGATSGVATLDANGKLTDTQKPGYTASEVGAAAATHASQHASEGSDPITPADIGALPLSGGTITGGLTINPLCDNGYGNIRKNNSSTNDYGTQLYDYTSNGDHVVLIVCASNDNDAQKLRFNIGNTSYVLYGGHNQTTPVDSTPAVAKIRSSSLNSTETTPSLNGQIAWTYE